MNNVNQWFVGLYLIFWKEKIARDAPALKPLLPARYLLAMMGFFACFCGFIYNDMMSLTFDFGTCYNLITDGTTETVERKADCYYPFGKIAEDSRDYGE